MKHKFSAIIEMQDDGTLDIKCNAVVDEITMSLLTDLAKLQEKYRVIAEVNAPEREGDL